MPGWDSVFGWRLRVFKEALLRFYESDGYALASHVALSLMIAVFPFLIFAVSLAGLMDTDGVSRGIIDLVFDYWLFRSDAVRWCAAFCLLIFVVFACHRWLPGRRRQLAQLRPGILLTLALWIIAASGFSLYLDSFANYSATYAGLAGIMTALIFLYLMAAILIFGAEYNSALTRAIDPICNVAKR